MERALFLFQQGRHEMAAAELRDAIAREPDNAHAYCFLALSLRELKQFDAAQAAADRARELEPNESFVHLVMSRVMHSRNMHTEALAAIDVAIQIDPEDKHYYVQRALIYMDLDKWAEVLRDSEEALRIDPEDSDSRNFRALAQRNLGREKEAGEDLEDVLAKNPEDSLTHANRGWSLLQQNNRVKAQEHFQEALRLDPENEFAREGYIDCLKSRSSIYALLLRFLLWQGQCAGRIGRQNLMIGGGVLLAAWLLASRNPTLNQFISPFMDLVVFVFVLTFASEHIFNLVLRVDPVGRHILNTEERFQSSVVGGWFLFTGVMAYPHVITGSRLWSPFPMLMLCMTIALVTTFNCPKGWPRRAMSIACIALVVSLIALIGETFYLRWYAETMGLSLPAPKKPGDALSALTAELGHLLNIIDVRTKHMKFHSYAYIATMLASFYLEEVKVKQ